MSGFPPYQVASPQVGAWPKPLDGPAKVVTAGLTGSAVAAAAGLAIQAYQAVTGRSDDVLSLVHPTLIVGALIFTGIAFICWLYRARANLYYFGVYDLRWKPGWTIGAWFIPIVNVVIPLLVVNEVDRASEQRAGVSASSTPGASAASTPGASASPGASAFASPGVSAGVSAGGTLGGRSVFVLWAICWSGFLLLDRYTSVATPSIVDLSARDLDRFNGLSVIATGLQIAAALFAIRLVRRITTNQQRVLAGGPPTYAQPPGYGQPPAYGSHGQPPAYGSHGSPAGPSAFGAAAYGDPAAGSQSSYPSRQSTVEPYSAPQPSAQPQAYAQPQPSAGPQAYAQPQPSAQPQAYAQPPSSAQSAPYVPVESSPELYRPPTSPSGGSPTSGDSVSPRPPDPPPPDPLRPPSDPWPSAGF